MIKRIIYILLAVAVLFSSGLVSSASDKPVMLSDTAILMDADTGQILYEKNMHKVKEPASITKIPTVYLSVVHASPEDLYTVVREDTQLIARATHISLLVGEVVSMENLQYAAMLMSANDACNAIANAVSGSYSEFAALMNEFAESSGALNTNFLNAHGLPEDGHVTTAYDMAMMTKAAIGNSDFVEIFSTVTYTMPETNLQPERYFANGDDSMKQNDPYYYSDVLGGKLGWTEEARHTKVTVATRGGRTLIAVVMDEANASSKYIDTAALFDYGFSSFSENIFTASIFEPVSLEVKDGVNVVGTAEAYLTQGATFLLHNTNSMGDVTYSHNLPDYIPFEVVEDTDYSVTISLPSSGGMYPATITLPLKVEFTPTIVTVVSLPFKEQAAWVATELLKVSSTSLAIMCAVFFAFTVLMLLRKYFILLNRFIMRKRHQARQRARVKAEAQRRRDVARKAKLQKEAILKNANRKKRQ